MHRKGARHRQQKKTKVDETNNQFTKLAEGDNATITEKLCADTKQGR